MTVVTIQVLDGLERGQVFSGMVLPFTIGREDDNAIRLNDERVSRFHAKVQEDGGRVIITDLDSTNGTRVNGHPIQMRVLQVGDQLSIGRCLLVFGSRDEISARAQQLAAAGEAESSSDQAPPSSPKKTLQAPPEDQASARPDDLDWCATLFPDGPPETPHDLRPVQRAQISDILAYLHDQIRCVTQAAQEEHVQHGGLKPHVTRVDWTTWQRMLKIEMDLAVYLRKIAEPDS
jgi:hypothetical protein